MPGLSPACVSIVNNIIWKNEIWLTEDTSAEQYTIRYNDIQGGWEGEGNINVDPLFANADKGDYHVKSQAGRWDPVLKAWTVDAVTSPCIDAGDPQTSFVKEPQSNGSRSQPGRLRRDGAGEQVPGRQECPLRRDSTRLLTAAAC